MNPDKTYFTILGTKSSIQKTSSFRITLSDSGHISPCPTVKVLGIVLDQGLTWEPQISAVIRKCNAIILSLFKIRHFFTQKALELLVQVHVFPHLLYCLPVWGGAAQCHMSRIQKTINFAARLVTGVRRFEHISPVLQSLGWPNVSEMVRERDCVKVFGALHNSDGPPALRALFVRRSEVSERETRAVAAGELQLERCRLAATQRSFSYRAAREWNSLPVAFTETRSRGAFLSAVRRSR